MSARAKLLYFTRLTIVPTLLCVFPIATLAQTGGLDQRPPPPLGKLVDVGGYRVHLYCIGAGSPTVVTVGAALSFDWGLVQPDVARFTQMCAYDHSGVGWSESGPKDSCSLRVSEVHTALKNAGIKGPYVLVGHSVGGLVARLYASRYPSEVSGMVFVDHAANLSIVLLGTPNNGATVSPPQPTPSEQPTVISSKPDVTKLPARDRDLHLWAVSQSQNQAAPRVNRGIVSECIADADSITKERVHPLGDRPLVDVSTSEDRNAEYVKLQTLLLSLSRNSKEIIADKSGHFVMIDRPDVIVDAIRQVVHSVRNNAKL